MDVDLVVDVDVNVNLDVVATVVVDVDDRRAKCADSVDAENRGQPATSEADTTGMLSFQRRWSVADSAKHYEIARGEAMESVASLDILKIRGLVMAEHHERGIALLEAVVAMLTKML